MRHNNSQSGFTLIEIMIVIVIIGFLAVTVLTALNSTRAKARDSQRKQAILNMQKALEDYFTANNSYPCSGTLVGSSCNAPYNWRAVINSNACPAGGNVSTSGATGYIPNFTPTYVTVLPADPKPATVSNNCSGYAYKSDGSNYKLISSNGALATLGSGGPEVAVAATDQVYDRCRAGTAMAVTNNPNVANNAATCVSGAW
jgi:prepilin-type N-terminal cleavage/methylation domain-containing protein